MRTKLRVFVACGGSAGIRVIKTILGTGHQIVGVMAQPDSQAISSPYRFAQNHNLPLFKAIRAKDPLFSNETSRLKTDLLLSIRFPYIFNNQILKSPTFGSVNLHTGLLPQYAGLNAPCWAIYNGEKRHGVTLHKMDSGIDTGPIIEQVSFAISEHDTGLSLTERTIEQGLILIERFLGYLKDKELHIIAQDLTKRNYYGSEIPQEGCINWRKSAQSIHDFIRASDFHPFQSPWGSPTFTYKGKKFAVCKSQLTHCSSNVLPGTVNVTTAGNVEIATADEWLRLDLIRQSNQYPIPAEVFENGTIAEN